MLVSLNGKFVAEEEAFVPIADRGFRYGDALFEAVLVRHGKMFRWPQHAARLERSAAALKIPLPQSLATMEDTARELIQLNRATDTVLRVQLSRGTGPRGYAPSGDEKPLLVMSLHPAPERPLVATRWTLTVSSLRVPSNDLLTHHKTCSRLLQVMAATEARERGADECLLLNTDGYVTEGSTSNVFWIERGQVGTTPLHAGLLPGVTRAAIFEICEANGIPIAERTIRPEDLPSCDAVFLTLTSRGIVEAESIDGQPLRRSEITARLQQALEALLEHECATDQCSSK